MFLDRPHERNAEIALCTVTDSPGRQASLNEMLLQKQKSKQNMCAKLLNGKVDAHLHDDDSTSVRFNTVMSAIRCRSRCVCYLKTRVIF